MMQPNPVLKKLGFSNSDRIVIFHADDIGVCQASVDAYADLLDFGLLSSAAAMVPCGWFPTVAALCRDHQEHPRLDMGIHLTLTSEYNTLRWGPISTRQATSGLLDEEGYLHRTSAAVQEQANPVAVAQELEAQIEQALAAGVRPTHIDTHMGTVFHPKFLSSYVELAQRYRVVAFAPRWDEVRLQQAGYDAEATAQIVRILQQSEAEGMPLVDEVIGMPLEIGADRMGHIKQVLTNLVPGITHFIIHPVRDTPEVHPMTASWPQRVNDRDLFLSEELRTFVQQQGIHVIGYRALQELA
jgi:chitin disaccharide deacetylase